MDDLSACALCGGGDGALGGSLGPLLGPIPGAGPGGGAGAVHRACGLWSPEVCERNKNECAT